jgi:rubrerythrin
MNLFSFAMKMEKDGESYYRELSRMVANKDIAFILNELAGDEARHRNILEEMSENYDPGILETHILDKAKNIFEQMKIQNEMPFISDSEIECYKEAIKIEIASMNFYLDKKNELSNPEQNKIFVKLAAQEEMHRFVLDGLIDSIRKSEDKK